MKISKYVRQLLEQYKDDKSNGLIPDRAKIKSRSQVIYATEDLSFSPSINYFEGRGEGSELKRLKSLRLELTKILDMNYERQSVLEDELAMISMSINEKIKNLQAHEEKVKIELMHLNKKLRGNN